MTVFPMTLPWWRREGWWPGAVLPLAVALLVGCGSEQPPSQGLEPTAWRLTVSPIEPAAGIKAEVTMQRIAQGGQPLPTLPDVVPPQARARLLGEDLVVWSGPAQLDRRGRWLAPLIFPAPGRWQVVIHEAVDSRRPLGEGGPLSWPSLDRYGPSQVVRDANGREDLSLLITVIPDRGPVLWWLRTHLLEVFGVIVILTASVLSYGFRGRLFPQAER